MSHITPNTSHEELIDSLSTSLKPSSVFHPGSVLNTLSILLVLSVLAIVITFMGMRDGWVLASHLKVGFLACAALTMLALVISRATPVNYSKNWMLLALAASITTGTLLTIKGISLSVAQATEVPTFDWCLSFIAGLGIAGFAIMRFVLVRARPRQPRIFSAMLAMLSALIASIGYATFCPIDSITYLGTAYAIGIVAATFVGYLFPRKQWYW